MSDTVIQRDQFHSGGRSKSRRSRENGVQTTYLDQSWDFGKASAEQKLLSNHNKSYFNTIFSNIKINFKNP